MKFLITFFNFFVATLSSGVVNELEILAMVPVTGKEPANGKACMAAHQIVIDAANAKKDFFPEYHLKLRIRDEARNAQNAPSSLFNYLLEDRENGSFVSPVVVGPSITCQYVSFAAKHVYITQFSQFCAGPWLVRRDILPGLYRVQMPGEYSVIASMLFMLQVGHWRQFGIFTYSLNINEYTMAKKLKEMGEENGMEIVHYTSEDDITLPMLQQAKKDGSRVIAMIYLQVAMCVKILCHAYNAGMRAPQYSFVALVFCSFTPTKDMKLPPDCTVEMLEEQLKVTFWVGPAQIAVRNNGPTSLGYDLPVFEQRLNEILDYQTAPDADQRHLCHDTMLAALTTLRNADYELRRKHNMTIMDYKNNEQFVSYYVNKSATEVEFDGLRIGKIKYSPRFELSNEQIWIMQWWDGEIRWLYEVPWTDNGTQSIKSLYNLKTYKLRENQPVQWLTKHGGPPKDLSYHIRQSKNLPTSTMTIVCALAGFGCIFNFANIIIALVKRKELVATNRLHIPSDFAMIFLCLLGNASAVFISVGKITLADDFYCSFSLVLVSVFAFSIHTLVLVKSYILSIIGVYLQDGEHGFSIFTQIGFRKKSKERQNFHQQKCRAQHRQAVPIWHREVIDRATIPFTILVAIAVIILDLIWIFHPSQGVKAVVVNYEPYYDIDQDTNINVAETFCTSPKHSIWIAVFVVLNFLILMVLCFVALGNGMKAFPGEFQIDAKTSRSVSFIMIPLFIATILITFIVSYDFNLQLAIVSFALIIYSLMVSSFWCYPIWKRPTIGNSDMNWPRNGDTMKATFNIRNKELVTVHPRQQQLKKKKHPWQAAKQNRMPRRSNSLGSDLNKLAMKPANFHHTMMKTMPHV